MKVAFVRGGYLNNFEGQNYKNLGKSIKLKAFASIKSIHNKFAFDVIRLPSLYDLGIPSWLANRTLGDRQNLLGLEESVKGFDIVHTADPHYYYSYQLAKLKKAKKLNRLISTSWETIPFNNESTNAKRRIKRFTMKYVDRFLCYSQRAKTCLIKEGVSPKKITVISLGVDINKFSRHKVGIPTLRSSEKVLRRTNKVRILFVGRDVPEKGLNDLRGSINHLIEQGKDVELLVAGNIPYEKMAEVYRLADIFVMPSKTIKTWEEQYGMVLLEAMASGLPIVAYRSGAIPELLGKAGIIVPEGDTVQLINQLKHLVESPSLRKKLGVQARIRAEKLYDSKKFSLEVGKFYKKVYFSV